VSRVADSELRLLVEAAEGELLTPYIDDAHLLVDETLGTDSGLTNERLKLIEKYLAAHLWVLAEEKGGHTGETRGDASLTYAKFEGNGLAGTRFGQQVIDFDSTGELEKVMGSASKKAEFRLV